ncbi:shikimate kinase [Xanthomarina sp. F1114]|uniref:shikimate kinase n=1 Tax=Xanthomarina sp. F1114 TaxID=2996019 RepID=UPI00225E3BAE|nr:shikimate kinase [Xanthomarina sp. F1114]MCX7548883.1 shikimate kinase [Xanthomarina sp. F1114]
MRIILIGYMASGKSLIGRELARVLDFEFLDLDDFIEENEKMPISEIFSEKGEIVFRKIENNYLKEVLSSKNKMVLSLGGGTPCFSNNLKVILEDKNAKSFFLNVPVSELAKRLMADKENRPLVNYVSNEEDMLEFVGKHIFERLSFYNQANFKIEANKPKEEVVEDIISKLF